ncbi:hypothetical protein ACFBZI_08695 [Moraxella sp. ZJ142]|uniref:hypothetical protein n=1 Tax=Moraxella marmotae TaxID=3344520 RepID=UPI0035D422F4
MSVDIDDLHRCIDALFADIDEQSAESLFRAYINRSYYAVFHELRFTMQQANCGINRYHTGTHNNLCQTLDDMAKDNKAIQKLAMQFRDFLTKRHHADYELQTTVTWYDVKQAQQYRQNLPKIIQEHIK